MRCPKCGVENRPENRFCGSCGQGMAVAAPNQTPASSGLRSGHSPFLALLLALVIPGAGYAYNGRPIKGFFTLFLTPLVVPYLLSLFGSYSTAARMRAAGLGTGCSGILWVFLQIWLLINTALVVVIVLTVTGVLK
jgi:TM2 domain-containing membrane protein YozV